MLGLIIRGVAGGTERNPQLRLVVNRHLYKENQPKSQANMVEIAVNMHALATMLAEMLDYQPCQ